MDRITIRLDGQLKQRLETEARSKGVKPSVIIRQALEEHIERQAPAESAYDVAMRLGIIGVFKDGPSDLSSNPAHMEGFGCE